MKEKIAGNFRDNINSCIHEEKNKIILNSWKPNIYYGKFRKVGYPKKCTEICVNCGKKLKTWKL